MNGYELLKAGQSLLEAMEKAGLNVSDAKYVYMYEDYNTMLAQGHKKVYIISKLSDKYRISERNFYYIIQKLSKLVIF